MVLTPGSNPSRWGESSVGTMVAGFPCGLPLRAGPQLNRRTLRRPRFPGFEVDCLCHRSSHEVTSALPPVTNRSPAPADA